MKTLLKSHITLESIMHGVRHTVGAVADLTLNRYELRAGREWLADCAGTADVAAYWLNERSDGQGDGASDRQVRLTVGRHFKGGLVEFKRMVNAEGTA